MGWCLRSLALLLACATTLTGCMAPAPPATAEPDPAEPAGPGPTLPGPSEDAAVLVPWRKDGEVAADYLAVCLPAGPDGCLGVHSSDQGQFELSRPLLDGSLVARWTAAKPTEDELKIIVYRGDQFYRNATGPSPLAVDLGALPIGTYHVNVFFTGPAGAMVDQHVAWTAQGNQTA